MPERSCGILLHITSLPSRFGIGDFGGGAHEFTAFLQAAGQRTWQILPLNPTDGAYGDSPYSSDSAFALNPLFIDLEELIREGLLEAGHLDGAPPFPPGHVEYDAVRTFKADLCALAAAEFRLSADHGAFQAFSREQAAWLDDYALFRAIKDEQNGQVWDRWPAGLRDREQAALAEARQLLAQRIEEIKIVQFWLFRQWHVLREACRLRGIGILGDVPIYVNYDSADVWANRHIFKLGPSGRPEFVAGVPPDYFSKTGQLWGNPLYDWEASARQDYAWWRQRFRHNLALFDRVRIDHFRGFVGFWEVPSGEKTAENGRWARGPGAKIFERIRMDLPDLPLVAEDLGTITPDVVAVMDRFGFPGMKVLLFAFGEDVATHPYLPANHPRNAVAYTGTHDNNTVRGWYLEDASEREKKNLAAFLGHEPDAGHLPRELVRGLLLSPAADVIIPLQDWLGLGAEARMNTPGTAIGNWRWRVPSERLTARWAAEVRSECAAVRGEA